MPLQAVPPPGSISYINNSTASIHPIASRIEIRKKGKIGRVYCPAPCLTDENQEYYVDAYELGYEKVIDMYAVATEHVDQGLSLTLFFKDAAATRDINKAQIYAWNKGSRRSTTSGSASSRWKEPGARRLRQPRALTP